MKTLYFRNRTLEIGSLPGLVGILNVTPDSFSDGGSSVPLEERINRLLADGASVIDIGGESTRPGSMDVSEEEELKRVLPALELTRSISHSIIISIDTRKARVGEECLQRDADIINDVSGFRYDPNLLSVAARYDAGVIAMHSRSTPDRMQETENLFYADGIETVVSEMQTLLNTIWNAGIRKERTIVDAGIGFAKPADFSMDMIRRGELFQRWGCATLSAPSRKAFIGKLTGETLASHRDYGTCGAVIASAEKGYDLIRVHNVRAAMDALKVYSACCVK